MTDVDKIRELLNLTGFPFQHHCADRLAKLPKLQVSAEVSFTHPPTNGPVLGVHGAIDLLAACPSINDDVLVFFVIECKKANDKIKNWIFLPNKQQDPKWPMFFFSTQSASEPMQLQVTRSATFPSLGLARSVDFDFCINGIEANAALSTTNRDQSEKIYNPLKQVVHGTVAFESAFPKVVEGIEYLRHGQYSTHLYIPVVITTANLYTADFPVDQLQQGEIQPGTLSLTGPRKWLTFEFPLPDYLSYGAERDGGLVNIPRRTVFIVHDQSIDEFFTSALDVHTLKNVPVRE